MNHIDVGHGTCGHKRAELGTTLWQPDPDSSVSAGRSVTREKGPKDVSVTSFMRVRGHLALCYQVHGRIMADINPSDSLHG